MNLPLKTGVLGLGALTLVTAVGPAAEPLPIIPGAAGFGMETPAGSGRHLQDASLAPGWDDALVGHWNFDDGKPGGTLEGSAALVARDRGHALKLDGEGRLSLARAEGYAKPGGSFTIMAWVHMDAPFGTVAASTTGDGGHWELSHVRHGVGKWMFGGKGEQGQSHAMWVRDVDEPRWRHVAGVYDGETGLLRLYVNASEVGGSGRNGVQNLAAAQSSKLALGKGLTGLIDDVMFFDAALTQDQILALQASRHDAYLGPDRTTVYKVTNLNTEGPGSLREALEAAGPRVVVFEVSGNIDFTPLGSLGIRHPYITVAGQTAPSPGITLKGCELSISTHDVLLQHIRVRTGDLLDPKRPERGVGGWSQWSERDCMKVHGERIVIDHCTFSWSTDELVQTRARHTTFRQNLFTECLNSTKHHKGTHSKALLILDQGDRERVLPESRRDSRYVAVLGNLFAYNADRHPAAQGGAKVAIVNNFIYGVTQRPGVGITLGNSSPRGSRGGEIWATVVGNHFDNVPGPVRFISRPAEIKGKVFFDDLLISYTRAERRAHEALVKKTVDDKQFQDYLAGEEWPEEGEDGLVHEHLQDPWKASHLLLFRHWMGGPVDPDTGRVDEPPVVVPGLQVKAADQVREWTLASAGSRPADRDPVDARVIEQVRARRGSIIKSQEDVGGWPKLEESRRELTLPEKPSGDDDGDGYTNLEEWLHEFAARVEGRHPPKATVHHSSGLGWTAGQDITDEFAGLLENGELKAGDELVLDHTYRISGSHTLPDGFTLSAVKGAGFDVTDAKDRGQFLVLGNSNTLHNLTITYLDTPELGGRSIKHGVDFFDKRGINASGKTQLAIENCRLKGMIAHHVVFRDCDQAKLVGCHIVGGFWSVVVSGRDLVFRRCLIEKACGDAIKGGADGALVEDCVFQDNGRDGIDTTGGLNDTVIRNCIFRRMGREGLDLKSHYERETDLSRPENVGILIDKCLFHDMSNAIVLTTLDNGRRNQGKDLLTASNIAKYAPHDIDINDCVFGHAEKPLRTWREGGYGVNYPSEEGEHMRVILLKDAHAVRYRNARLSGDRIRMVYVHSIGGGKALSREAAEALDPSVAGNVLEEPAPPIEPGQTEVPFACGPQPRE